MRGSNRNGKDEDIISRMRFGHTGLNSTLHIMKKTGRCEHCGLQETVEHILLECPRYQQERQTLKITL